MRPYLAALAFVTLCGVAPHAAGHQQAAPPPSTQQPPATPPTQPGQQAPPPSAPQPGVQPPAVPPQPAAQPAVPLPPALIGRVFGSDAGMIFNPVKPDRTMDFEMVMMRLKEALAQSKDPVRQKQAAGWKVFKAVDAGPNNTVLYVFLVDPAVKGADYTITKVLNEAFPAEVQELYKLYIGASAGSQSLLNLQLVQNFGEAPVAGVDASDPPRPTKPD